MATWSLPIALNHSILTAVQRILDEFQRNLGNEAEENQDRESNEDDMLDDFIDDYEGEGIADNGEGDTPRMEQEIVVTPDSSRTRRRRNRFTASKGEIYRARKSSTDIDENSRNRMRSRSPIVLRIRQESV